MTLAVPLPTLADKQLYYLQPIITNGTGETRWTNTTTVPQKPPLERKAVTLKYKPPAGGKQTAALVSNGNFKILDGDGKEMALGLNLKAAFTEKFAEEQPHGFPLRLTYDRFGLTITEDNKPVKKDDEIRKMQTDIRFAAADVEMDKDVTVARSKADLRQVPKGSQDMISDLSDQILESVEVLSIPLPSKKVEPLETWKAQRHFLIGTGLISVPVQADIVYTYKGVQVRDGKEGALIGIEGRVRGRKGDGVDVGGTLSGVAYVSLETGEVLSADTSVKADMDLTFQRKPSKAIATLSVYIKRPAPPPMPKP